MLLHTKNAMVSKYESEWLSTAEQESYIRGTRGLNTAILITAGSVLLMYLSIVYDAATNGALLESKVGTAGLAVGAFGTLCGLVKGFYHSHQHG